MLPSIGCSPIIRLIPSLGKAKTCRKGTPGSLPLGAAAPFRTPQRTWYLERKNNPSFISASKDSVTILTLLCLVKKKKIKKKKSQCSPVLALDTDAGYHPLGLSADSHHGSYRKGLICWLKPVRKTWKNFNTLSLLNCSGLRVMSPDRKKEKKKKHLKFKANLAPSMGCRGALSIPQQRGRRALEEGGSAFP